MVNTNVGNEFSAYVISRAAKSFIMTININNQEYQFEENTSLENAMRTLKIEAEGIALAINEEIIPRSKWNDTILNNEDKIIIIGAVAGG